MKKILLIILFIGFFGISAVFCAENSNKGVIRTEIETKDGMILVGDFYPSKVKNQKMPLVIMLHSFEGKSGDWGNLPEQIRTEGNNVFALDLRGHGRSVYNKNLTYKSSKHFRHETWQKFPNDVVEVINFMKDTYSKVDYSKITFVGADLGANTAILVGEKLKQDKPVKFVLISPIQNFKGLYIPIAISNYPNTPMLIMVSDADKYFYHQANILSKFIQSPHILKVYQQGGSGTLLLKRNPSSYGEIVKFIYN